MFNRECSNQNLELIKSKSKNVQESVTIQSLKLKNVQESVTIQSLKLFNLHIKSHSHSNISEVLFFFHCVLLVQLSYSFLLPETDPWALADPKMH